MNKRIALDRVGTRSAFILLLIYRPGASSLPTSLIGFMEIQSSRLACLPLQLMDELMASGTSLISASCVAAEFPTCI